MHKGQDELGQLRKKIVTLLEEYGYQCHVHGEDKGSMQFPDNQIASPQAGDLSGMIFEDDLKKINSGEAYWLAESCAPEIEILPHFMRSRGYLERSREGDERSRGNSLRSDLDKCRSSFFHYLHFGYEFEYQPEKGIGSYGIVQLIDYNRPERNSFRAATLWDGLLRDNFLWDVVVTVNTMPLAVAVLQPTTPGNRPCQDAIETLHYQLANDPIVSAYLQLCIVSDGNQTLVGSPTDCADQFKPWASLIGEEGIDDVLTPIRALLRPDRLLEVLHNYCWQEKNIKGKLFQYVADYHQFFAIRAMVERVKQCLFEVPESPLWGHVQMLKAEAESNSCNWGAQTHAMAHLLYAQIDRLPEMWCDANGQSWCIRLVDTPPDAARMAQFEAETDRILFVALPKFTAAQCHELLAHFPKAALLQVVAQPTDQELLGPCLYRASRTMQTFANPAQTPHEP